MVEQLNWFQCNKCQALAYGGNTASAPCSAGGEHDYAGSQNSILDLDVGLPPIQDNWRWCSKCQTLVYGGITAGPCPAGDVHDHSGSGNYELNQVGQWGLQNVYPDPQDNWRWCTKCQALVYGGSIPGPCPAGDVHELSKSGDYYLNLNDPRIYQDNWRWCTKCQALAYAGNATAGPCPAGGEHDHTGSGNYTLVQNERGNYIVQNWRWGTKCQVLTAGLGPCPAGGEHDHTGSGNYSLTYEYQ